MKKLVLGLMYLFCASVSHAQIQVDTAVYSNKQLYSLLIAKDGRIIYSKYFNNKTADTLFNDQSLTKSVTALLVGIAIDKGYIKTIDQEIVHFFPELKWDKDKRKQHITIRQLMNQASGLYSEGQNIGALFSLPNPSKYVLTASLLSEPGKVFNYSNAASHLLSVILTKSTGMDTRAFAIKVLFDPLDIKSFAWDKMRDGYYDGSGLAGLSLRSADMLKIGMMILNNGSFNGKQLVSAKWIAAINKPEVTYATPWGLSNSQYGLCWYHVNYKGVQITYALGWGGQFMFVIPSLKAVIVTNSSIADETAIRQAALITGRLFPALFNQLKK